MKKICALCFSLLFLSPTSQALNLNDYLNQVKLKNKLFLSLDASTEAASSRYEQANLELSPVLTASETYLDDKSLQQSFFGGTTHTQIRQSSLGFNKKFSSGTTAGIQASVQSANIEGNFLPAGAASFEQHTGTLALSLSQSLWKDFFGRSTKLRWQREISQQRSEKLSYDLKARQSLIEAEDVFWDLMYLQAELDLRRASLERAKKIVGWVQRRAGNGIGDNADVLNAQSLVAVRELQLMNSADDLLAAQKKLADEIELPQGEAVPHLEGSLEQARPLTSFVVGSSGRILRMDAYLSVLNAEVTRINAEEALEKVRPDLTVQGQYKTNGYDSTDPAAARRMTDSDHPVASVGVNFSWLLDWESKNSLRDSARKDALASSLKKEHSLRESETSWSEINRRSTELGWKIHAAQNISHIQTAKAAAEREKFNKGRSITSNVILAEQDAAEAELSLTKLKAEHRKLESQGRLFFKVPEGT